MDKNVGGYDRIARYIIGAILTIIGIVGYAGMITVAIGPISQALMSILLVVVGAILLVTGYLQQCPVNRAIGLNTFKPGSH